MIEGMEKAIIVIEFFPLIVITLIGFIVFYIVYKVTTQKKKTKEVLQHLLVLLFFLTSIIVGTVLFTYGIVGGLYNYHSVFLGVVYSLVLISVLSYSVLGTGTRQG